MRSVRYRTVGDMSGTAAVLSRAGTVDEVIAEFKASRISERGATRADDRFSEAAMEDRKKRATASAGLARSIPVSPFDLFNKLA